MDLGLARKIVFPCKIKTEMSLRKLICIRSFILFHPFFFFSKCI